MRQLFFIGAALLLVTACKPKPTVGDNGAGDGGIADVSAAERVMQQMIEAQNVVDWLDARARVRIESQALTVGGTAFIRLKRNEWVWASVKKFGFEAARVLVTPDSVYVINRLDNSYSIEPLSYLGTRYKLPARFDLLQQIVVGNPIFFDRDLEHEATAEQHRLFGKSNRWESDYWLDLDTYSLERMRLEEVGANRSLDLELSDFRDIGLKNGFSHERVVSIEAPDSGNSRLELSFNRLTVNEPTDYVFDIPERFERQ